MIRENVDTPQVSKALHGEILHNANFNFNNLTKQNLPGMISLLVHINDLSVWWFHK